MSCMVQRASSRLQPERCIVAVGLLALAFLAGCDGEQPGPETGSDATTEPREYRYTSYTEVQTLFDELDYTAETWMAGVRAVPRVYLQQIRPEWSRRTVHEIDVLTKKRLFFRVLGPLVLKTNELIMADRQRLTSLAGSDAVSDVDREWLTTLAVEYRLDAEDYASDAERIEALMPRVDIVPVSLALSQSAEESGWGTSRFAFAGNALFGQWAWGEGIRPEQQRGNKGDYRIAVFETPLDSVRAYARNLNTHSAYAEFRRARADLRKAGKHVHGADLVSTLKRYSERGDAYVQTLRTIMRVNRLHEADDAYLTAMRPILLVAESE